MEKSKATRRQQSLHCSDAGFAPAARRVTQWLTVAVLIVAGFSTVALAEEIDAVITFESLPTGAIVSEVSGESSSGAVGPIAVNGEVPSNPLPNSAVIFDSSNPPGIDFDLGTPNQTFGGPGIGPAGRIGQPNQNAVALGNLLIFQEPDLLVDADNNSIVDGIPNDADEFGMVFDFDFSNITLPFVPEQVTVMALTSIDGENSESPGLVRFFNASNILIATHLIPETGCNGVARHVFGTPGVGIVGVDRVEVQLNGSGGIDNIEFRVMVPTPPVANLMCTLTDPCTCAVDLSWVNGSTNYDSIDISVGGMLVTSVAGSATSAQILLPGFGVQEICVTPTEGGVPAVATCCSVNCPDIPATPVSALSCVADMLDCSVAVTWTNNGPYTSIAVTLDGAPFATLPGTATSVNIPGPSEGLHEVCVSATNSCAEPVPPVCCTYDCMITPPQPVMNLMCDVTQCTCELTATWVNAELNYDSIQVTLQGAPVASLPGDATSFMTTLATPGMYELCVTPVRSGVSAMTQCCSVECVEVPATAPINLVCMVGAVPDCITTVTWENTSQYASIQVLLDGVEVQSLPGTATSASVDIPDGTHQICLNGMTVCNEPFPEVCCTVMCNATPPPITDLLCTVIDVCSCAVSVSWVNGADDYDTINVLTNGILQATIPGNLASLTLMLTSPGIAEICLVPVRAGLSGDPTCCTVDCPDIPDLPPANLSCLPDPQNCSVEVTWTNSSQYSGIVVTLQGMIVAALPGDAESVTLPGPLQGMMEVCVQATTICSVTLPPVCCDFDCAITPPGTLVELNCVLTDPCTCEVTLDWMLGGIYDQITIFVDAVELQVLGGAATSAVINLPSAGIHEICLEPSFLGVSGDQECCTVNCPVTSAFPPNMLACSANPGDCATTISWTNRAEYQSIEVSLNGVLVETLPGTAQQTSLIITKPGINEVCLNGMTVCDEAFPEVCCEVTCAGLVPNPISNLSCMVIDNCDCVLAAVWTNNDAYDQIVVQLDGVEIDTLPGTELMVMFPLPDGLPHEICVIPSCNGVPATPVCCPATCTGIPTTAPADLVCTVDTGGDACVATLSWTNTTMLQEISITVDGLPSATLAGTAMTAMVELVGPGPFEICVAGTTTCGETTGNTCCTVQCDSLFIRGECNDDDRGLDLADAIFLLRFFFQNGDNPNCVGACDLNNDGALSMGDAIFVFEYMFLGGSPPSAPFPDCGTDPGVICDSYLSCP